MYVAEGRMRGNLGTFVVEEAEDEAAATMALRHCYKCLRTESTQVKMAKKLTNPEVEEEIEALLYSESPRKQRYNIYNLDQGKYFIEFFYLPYEGE